MHRTRSNGTPYAVGECRIYQSFRQGEGSHVDDEVFCRKDGTSFPTEYWSYPILRDGKPIGAVATFLDITERKRNEEAFRHLAAIVEGSDDAIIGESLAGIITSGNAGAERIYGYSADEIVGKSVSILAPPERRAEIQEILENVKRERKASSSRRSARERKDGKQIDIALTVSPIKDGMGRISGAAIDSPLGVFGREYSKLFFLSNGPLRVDSCLDDTSLGALKERGALD